MFKLSVLVVLGLAFCIAADPIYQKPLRRRVLARQQLQSTQAPIGYPPAGITPDVPFELPTETEKPDEVYGPPKVDVQEPDETYGPPESEIQQPDEVYGPPKSQTVQPESETDPEIIEEPNDEADEEELIEDVAEDLDEVDEHDSVISVATTFENPARLVYQRFPQGRQHPTAVPSRIVKAKPVKPANFIYTSRFQTFPQK